ncbi:phosphatase PAP2 family protein [Aliiroseovarius sp. KMU-50]|uniref:Phosphatase PAP2 family protein n=1 Tax=Aliiroseovarius salicola TaxID=3009082 RepID=A0ABT4VWA9_9RHOB|nr:phosphatase PAP2 family protein [Aliiroseovarius sp. KMU-50]MDA5092544.1 phosphatase PAP2 family protein [Aliiroseovarius sp. KMU-50]
MRLFALTILAYIVISGLVTMIFRDNPLHLFAEMVEFVPWIVLETLSNGWWGVPLLLVATALYNRADIVNRLSKAIITVGLCAVFISMFTIMKATMPFLVPFWADPLFADLDRVLHLGRDPWVFTHAVSGWINPDWVAPIYYPIWSVPAIFLPVLMVLFDNDTQRIRRFTILYLFTWIGLGNVLAVAFMSAGPVYYDRLVGGSDFEGMRAALHDVGLMPNYLYALTENLWSYYINDVQRAGAGISAFPSVHIGAATMFGLYLYDRHRGFLPISILIVALYQFLSVYQGWHYAIDGYFSILAVVVVWIWLRRKEREDAISPAAVT